MGDENKRGTPDTNFTSVTFEDIKKKLVEKAKAYYPETYRDFNGSSFGSMMLDMVSLVGEQLNFYAQFVANESFVASTRTSAGYEMHANKYEIDIGPSATYTNLELYSLLAADPTNSVPLLGSGYTILAGLEAESEEGIRVTTLEDIYVSPQSQNTLGTTFTSDGSSHSMFTHVFSVPCVSGDVKVMTFDVGTYEKFLKVQIRDSDVTSILSVFDSEGHEYFQVENLSQDVIWTDLVDRGSSSDTIPILAPKPVPRRFQFKRESNGKAYICFGYGSEDSLQIKQVAESAKIALDQHGKGKVLDTVVDPNRYLKTDKFGVAPKNTILTVTYRVNTAENSNASAGSIKTVLSAEVVFDDETILPEVTKNRIRNSLSCNNKEPLNGSVTYSSTQEVAEVIAAAAGAQGRAVTVKDYMSQAYRMPNKYGKIKKISLHRDKNDLKRNLNMYCISEDSSGNLQQASSVLKNNLKTWINSARMMSDTIDIFDAKILNLGLIIDVTLNESTNKTTAITKIREELYNELRLVTPEVGQTFSIGEVKRILNSMAIVNRINKIQVTVKNGPKHSDTRHDISSNISPDGGLVYMPENFIWEIKSPTDITGKVK
jgi:hypothetical protein